MTDPPAGAAVRERRGTRESLVNSPGLPRLSRRAPRRVAGLIVVSLFVALAGDSPPPVGGSVFPLAPAWDALAAKAERALRGTPKTPEQKHGGPVASPAESSAEATRSNGGSGRAPGAVPGALKPYTPPGRDDRPEWTTPA